jgi:hypothetical protein
MAKMFLESCREFDLFIVNFFLLEDLIRSCERFEGLRYFGKNNELDNNKSLTFRFPD